MKIETKFDIGQEVWYVVGSTPYAMVVACIEIRTTGTGYWDNELFATFMKESCLYESREAAERAARPPERGNFPNLNGDI